MISIITPAYNRGYTLQRLYNSLINQNNKNFEWIIVDDGSEDDTKSMCQNFIIDSKIKITYFYQKNSGKPTAINTGVSLSNGEYVFIVDSDDFLTSDSLSFIYEKIEFHTVRDDVFSGLCFRRGDLSGIAIGEPISESFNEYDFYHATEIKNKLNVDLAYIFKKSYIDQIKFPKFKNENFVPELFVWNKITDKAKVILYFNKIVYLCEYLPDGLSANFKSQLKKNPQGFSLYYSDQYYREDKLINKIKMLIRFIQCKYYSLLA